MKIKWFAIERWNENPGGWVAYDYIRGFKGAKGDLKFYHDRHGGRWRIVNDDTKEVVLETKG